MSETNDFLETEGPSDAGELANRKREYAKTGFFYILILLITLDLQLVEGVIIRKLNPSLLNSSEALMLLSTLPMWCISMPITYFLMKKLVQKGEPAWRKQKAYVQEKEPFTVGSFFTCFFIAVFLMYIGNVIGVTVANMMNSLFKLGLENNTIELISNQKLGLSIILTALIGPIVEEFIFRKVLIDGVGRYSGKAAIILSGVMFGLFHMNVYQIFYATLMGVLLAYIYVRTGKIWITMLLHIMINTFQGIIPLVLLKNLDLDALLGAAGGEMTEESIAHMTEVVQSSGFMAFLMYITAVLIFWIIGLVLFIKNKHKLTEMELGPNLKKGELFKTVFLNIGMIVYIIGTLLFTFVQ